MVFVARLRQLYSLQVAFAAINVRVEYVTGTTPKEKRTVILDRFKNGETPVLINCGALVEGADLPCVRLHHTGIVRGSIWGALRADYQIDCVVLARPTKSKILVTQMVSVSRIHRQHP